MHCNNFDNNICWHIELRNCRFTLWVAYQNMVTLLDFCQQKSKSIRNGIISQLRHHDCIAIGRHRAYSSLIIKASLCQFSEQYNIDTFNTFVHFNTPYAIKFILTWWKWVYFNFFLPTTVWLYIYIHHTAHSSEMLHHNDIMGARVKMLLFGANINQHVV